MARIELLVRKSKPPTKDGLLQLDAIVETYWAIHKQHPSAWTHELNLRSFKEPF